jgi:hypothetical protein
MLVAGSLAPKTMRRPFGDHSRSTFEPLGGAGARSGGWSRRQKSTAACYRARVSQFPQIATAAQRRGDVDGPTAASHEGGPCGWCVLSQSVSRCGSRRVREGMRVVRGNHHGAGAAPHMFKPREGVAGQFEKICTARRREEG